MDFSGKRVLVTGSTRGIGIETARAFMERGATVVVHGRSQGSVDRTVAELGGGIGLAADLGSLTECRRLIDASVEALGGLDVLVNNAGLGDGETFVDSDEALWQATMDINLRAPFFLTQYALPALRESGGNVVMVSSVSGLMGHPEGVSVYCTSKGGLNNMTRVLALELADQVRVNAIAPGPIDTDMLRELALTMADPVEEGYAILAQDCTAQKRIADARELAGPVLYLCSDLASFVTGTIHVVDGGETVD